MPASPIVILGKQPPPIGGVTIHVKRLIDQLIGHSVDHTYVQLRLGKLISLPTWLSSYKLIHIHSSNAAVIFWTVLWAQILSVVSVFTVHRDYEREQGWRRWLLRLSTKLATVPIVLNEKSLDLATQLNPEVRLIGSFIPPSDVQALPSESLQAIIKLGETYDRLLCTNAYDLSFDNANREIYQIAALVQAMESLPECALIISDPTGNNLAHLLRQGIPIPDGVIFLDYPHDFVAVMEQSDIFIRATSTDGDSLSLREALHLGLDVIATDVVSRPAGCHLMPFADYSRMCDIVRHLPKGEKKEKREQLNNAHELMALYEQLIKSNN